MDGVRITAVPVQHVGGRFGIDLAWYPHSFTGYVFEYHGLSVYFGGDTAYAPQLFREAQTRFPQLDLEDPGEPSADQAVRRLGQRGVHRAHERFRQTIRTP